MWRIAETAIDLLGTPNGGRRKACVTCAQRAGTVARKPPWGKQCRGGNSPVYRGESQTLCDAPTRRRRRGFERIGCGDRGNVLAAAVADARSRSPAATWPRSRSGDTPRKVLKRPRRLSAQGTGRRFFDRDGHAGGRARASAALRRGWRATRSAIRWPMKSRGATAAGARGPIVIIGHSLGADAAVEMAQRLNAAQGSGRAGRGVSARSRSASRDAERARAVNYYQANSSWRGRLARTGFHGLEHQSGQHAPDVNHFNIEKVDRLQIEHVKPGAWRSSAAAARYRKRRDRVRTSTADVLFRRGSRRPVDRRQRLEIGRHRRAVFLASAATCCG